MPVIRFRNNTAELAALHNLILEKGEPGWESDSNVFKIGNGVDHWIDLAPPNGGGGGGSAPNGTLVLERPFECTGWAAPFRTRPLRESTAMTFGQSRCRLIPQPKLSKEARWLTL